MEKPNLNNIWETYIKIDSEESIIGTIRSKLYPMLSHLRNINFIKWYCFLIHKSRMQGDKDLYFHVRFDPNEEITTKEQIIQILPDYCEKNMTTLCKTKENLNSISGINTTLLKNEDPAEAWKIIGEQSEWLMNLVGIHKEDTEIPVVQITQFMHFYLNMLGLGGHAVLYFGPTYQF